MLALRSSLWKWKWRDVHHHDGVPFQQTAALMRTRKAGGRRMEINRNAKALARTKFNLNRTLLAIALLMSSFAGSEAVAQQQDQCAGISDPIQSAQCYCQSKQSNYVDASNAILTQQAQDSPYLTNARNVVPGTPPPGASSSVTSALSQGCNGMVKGAMDSALSSLGSFMGFDIGTLLGGLANNAGSSMCSKVNNAIMAHTGFQCPRVNIPGFPVNCNVGLNVSSSGVSVNGGGNLGGYNTSGGVNTGINGVGSGGVSYNAGQGNTGYVSTGQINVGNSTAVQTAGSTATGVLSNAANSVACWFSGGPNCPQ